jgi:hypothetical protein
LSHFAHLECRSANVGDDIQTLAALQFIAGDPVWIDRDRVGRAKVKPGTKIILNRWFMHSPAAWPPPEELDPLIVSFHATPRKFRDSWRLEYLRSQSRTRPIGARDIDTLALLREGGVKNAYWSGCLTLTLQNGAPAERGEHLLAVDLPEEAIVALRTRTPRTVRVATQLMASSHRNWQWRLFGRRSFDHGSRIRQARQRLDDFAAAAAVVTTRLHAALPSLALGTPVLFVTDRQNDPRLSSWLPHLRWCTVDDFRAGRFDFDFCAPPANPTSWQPMAAALAAACSAFTGLAPRPYSAVAA